MANKFIQNISANTLQWVINQGFGVVIFYELSKELDKKTFGNLNWALAVLLTAFAILSFGLDQIVVRKIAIGEKQSSIISMYLMHVLLWGVGFYGLLSAASFISPSFFNQHYFLLFIGLGKLLNFFSTPFKQLSAGLEKFRLLMFMSTGSNIIKGVGLLVLSILGNVSVYSIIFIFVAGDIIELVLSIFIAIKYLKLRLSLQADLRNYSNLLKEALPQFGTVIFSSALARLDWILIGLLVSAAKLAEYSFAYKAFEIFTLPLLVVAPLLIPLFSRLFNQAIDRTKLKELRSILTIELVVASLAGLVLNILWVPVIDFITGGKYGLVNSRTIFILSLCMPFLYFNNFLWTINFSKGKLKMIFMVFAITFAVNLVGDLLLIPFFKNEGAATAYVFALATQSIIYIKRTNIVGLDKLLRPLLTCPACALLAGYVSMYFFKNTYSILSFSVLLYMLLIVLSGQFSYNNLKSLKRTLSFS